MSEFSLKPIAPDRPVILPHLAAIALTGFCAFISSLAVLVWGICG